MSILNNWVKKFWKDEEGMQTLEIMLIIAVIVVIALAFRKQIVGWVDDLLSFGDTKVNEFKQE
ncbi:Flp1 family type IVb pilin [Bacillus sp. FSL K6-3431]|uniref:Flp1 family type IVb pilin n=1 Tax=Bacillus sp. FSL K6-3431 TaxID=2921500 RepID=UPI0030FBCB30